MDGTGGQMKTFCKAHNAEPGGILCTAPKVSSPRRSPAGHQQRRKGALCVAAGQSQHFLAERLRRAERHDLAVLQPWNRHRQSSTAAARAPRESSGNWSSDLIVRRKQGLGKPALIMLNYPVDAKLIQSKFWNTSLNRWHGVCFQ